MPGGWAVLRYRFYSIKNDGHIAGPARNLDCADDAAAVKAGYERLDGHDIEIWQGRRVVGYLVRGGIKQNSLTKRFPAT